MRFTVKQRLKQFIIERTPKRVYGTYYICRKSSDFERGKGRKNYLNEKELRAMGQIVSGYLDFAERQAERGQVMTMADWAKHLDNILTMSGEQLLIGSGKVTHKQAMEKAENEYKNIKPVHLVKLKMIILAV